MSSDPEFKPGGGVPDGPVRISLQGGEPIVRADVTASQFMRFMAEQDPEHLERDRANRCSADLHSEPERHAVLHVRSP